MAERMSDLDNIINFEIPEFAEAVQELPEDVDEYVSKYLLKIMDEVINAFIRSEGNDFILEFAIPVFQGSVSEEYKETFFRVLNQGRILCGNISSCVFSSPNPREDYEKLRTRYIQNLEKYV